MKISKQIRLLILFLSLLIVLTAFSLVVNVALAVAQNHDGNTTFYVSIGIYSLALLIFSIILWHIWRRPHIHLHWIAWINNNPTASIGIFFFLLIFSFINTVWVAWLRLFSSLNDSYQTMRSALLFARQWNALFIWEWLLLVSLWLFVGYFLLTNKPLMRWIVCHDEHSTWLSAAVGLSSLGMGIIGLLRAMPFWFIPNAEQAERLMCETAYQETMVWFWIWAILGVFGAGILLHLKYKEKLTVLHWLPYLGALALSYGLITVYGYVKTPLGYDYQWDILYRSNDSAGYMSYQWGQMNMRPPMYPLFIRWIAGEDASQYLSGIPWNKPVRLQDNPLINVVRYQKVLMLAASLTTVFFLIGLLKSPFPALLFLAFYDTAFYTDFAGHLLTEALSAAWMFIILAAFFGFLWKKHGLFLIAMGLGCAGIYLTRPSGIFCMVFLGIAIIYALILRWKSYWLPSVISIIAAFLCMIGPSSVDYSIAGSFQPTPTFALQIVAFAVEVAQPDDIDIMPDQESRLFLKKVLEKKALEAEEERQLYPEEKYADVEMLRLRYRIANHKFRMSIGPASASEALGARANTANTTALMQKASIILLKRHWQEYLAIGWRQFEYAMNVLSRIKTPWSFIFLYLAAIIACFIVGGEIAWGSFALFAAHVVQVFIAGCFDIPTYRYIYATEYMVALGWGLILIQWFGRWQEMIGNSSQTEYKY